MPVPKKMRLAEDKYAADSDHQSDAEQGVQPMITKIKTVLKSESLSSSESSLCNKFVFTIIAIMRCIKL